MQNHWSFYSHTPVSSNVCGVDSCCEVEASAKQTTGQQQLAVKCLCQRRVEPLPTGVTIKHEDLEFKEIDIFMLETVCSLKTFQ